MNSYISFLILNCLLVLSLSFHVKTYPFQFGSMRIFNAKSQSPSKWPGTRPPKQSSAFLDQRMDASWGRGKFRTEVWEDDVNPVNDWWKAYAPTEEEIEAAAAGYDFQNPKEWFEVRSNDLICQRKYEINMHLEKRN